MLPVLSTPMRVSVVIPCHNSLRWLPETLDSVLVQTFGDFEVVLVDDGGTDDLVSWAGGLDDTRVRVVRQGNAGVAAARNRGIEAARGELIAFCDSDDLWVPHALEAMVRRHDEDPSVGLVFGWYDVVLADGSSTGRVEAWDLDGEVWDDFVLGNPVGMSATLVPAKVFDELGGFKVNRDRFPIDVEDWEMWIRIASTHPVSVVRDVLYHHRRHDSNSSDALESLELAYRHLLADVFEGQPPQRRALQGRATAHVDMILGWHSLNDEFDPERALGYRRSALRHDRRRLTSPDYWRLGLAARTMGTLGRSTFERVQAGARAGRRLLRLRRG